MSKQRLGRGLSALLEDIDAAEVLEEPNELGVDAEAGEAGIRRVPLDALERNPEQPRKMFSEAELDELAMSISQQGLLQPILVRPLPGTDARYQIIAGERRWRASQRAGLEAIPVVVRDLTDREVLEVALVENMQREDLNPMEEAAAFQMLAEQFGYTQETIARAVSKSRSHVANTIRLLALPATVRHHIAEGRLSAGHARAIATSEQVEALAETIIERGLSVREAERLSRGDVAVDPEASDPVASPGRAPASPAAKARHLIDLEADLSEALGLSVDLRDFGQKGGELRVRFSTAQQLDALVSLLLKRGR